MRLALSEEGLNLISETPRDANQIVGISISQIAQAHPEWFGKLVADGYDKVSLLVKLKKEPGADRPFDGG